MKHYNGVIYLNSLVALAHSRIEASIVANLTEASAE